MTGQTFGRDGAVRLQGWLAGAVLGLTLAVVACGEPPIDVDIPERGDAHVADTAQALDDVGSLEAALRQAADEEGVDIVVLTYETPQASCGEAFRAGRAFVQRWEADVAMIAVASPGGFASADAEPRPCVGVQPLDDFALARGVREEISEVLWPPLIEQGDWDAIFAVGAEQLNDALGEEGP